MTTLFADTAAPIDVEALADRFDPPYVTDPVGWIDDKMEDFTVWTKLAEVCESVVENRYTAVPSCHDSGKSYIASRLMAWWIDSHPVGEAFVVSTAPTQTQVEAILWREVGRAHRAGDLIGRITGGAVPQWKVGTEIVGYGRKPQDLTSKEEAMAAFQGIHARYVLVIIDEAGGVPKWLFDAVDTLVTNDNARVLAIGNPDDPGSQFAKVCAPGSGFNVIPISAYDTPAFSGEEVEEELLELLISETWVEERKSRWGESSPMFTSKVLGEFPDISDDTLIAPSLIKAAQARDLPGSAKGKYGLDVARYGTDETCIYRDRGGVIRLQFVGSKQDTTATTGVALKLLKDRRGAVPMVVDSIGVGAGVYDNLNNDGQPVEEFVASAKPIEKDRFVNKRAELYWTFREDMEAGEIDLPPDGEDDELISQLGSIRWYLDRKGRIGIESKDDMKKRGLPSPDRADAAVMTRLRGPRINIPDPKKGKRKTLTGDLRKKVM